MRDSLQVAAIIVTAAIAVQSALAESDWPQFRGPTGQGQSQHHSIPLHWSETENVRWKTELPGRGWSSPVVLGNQIWLTTGVETEATEADQEQRVAEHPIPIPDLRAMRSISLRALCVDRSTGELLYNLEIYQVDWPDPVHPLNSYSSPTPVLEPGRAYFNFGTWGTTCLDTETLEVLWRADYPLEHYVGPGSSPVLCGDRLILTCDGADRQFVVALDKTNGQEAWRAERPPISNTDPDFRKSYCTPLVVDASGRRQVIVPGAQWVVSYDPTSGSEFWRVEHGDGFSIVPRPVSDGNLVFICTGFGSRKEVLAIRPNGIGDVTDTHVEWRDSRQIPTMPSPVVHDDLLFMVSENGVATCRDSNTGELHWMKRLGGNYSASALLAGDAIHFFSREGVATTIAADRSYERLATNELASAVMATPAVIDEGLLLRTEDALYLFSEHVGGD